jgi:hypothetical protein
MLAEISLQVKQWDDAERYIELFDKKYPYQHFCGNEWAAYYIMKSTMEARLHEGQGKIDKAVRDLVPFIFDDRLASNKDVISLLKDILRRNYSSNEISSELTSALETIRVVDDDNHKKVVITMFGVDTTVDDYGMDNTVEAGKKIAMSNPVFVEFLDKKD